MQSPVAFWRPFGDETCQLIDGTQQVETSQPRGVQYFHEDLGSYGLQ
jgi:hypothetical protein